MDLGPILNFVQNDALRSLNKERLRRMATETWEITISNENCPMRAIGRCGLNIKRIGNRGGGIQQPCTKEHCPKVK